MFVKGGLAVLHETHDFSQVSNVGPVDTTGSASGDETRFAPVVGFGTEYALGGNWSIKGEYDYIRMFGQAYTSGGTAAVTGPPPAPGTIAFVQPFNKMQQDLHLVKFGVNYHFNPLPVVVAKY